MRVVLLASRSSPSFITAGPRCPLLLPARPKPLGFFPSQSRPASHSWYSNVGQRKRAIRAVEPGLFTPGLAKRSQTKPAAVAVDPDETSGEHAAVEVGTQLSLDESRYG